jgi:hypothetical protein
MARYKLQTRAGDVIISKKTLMVVKNKMTKSKSKADYSTDDADEEPVDPKKFEEEYIAKKVQICPVVVEPTAKKEKPPNSGSLNYFKRFD